MTNKDEARCVNGVPYICYKTDHGWRLTQGSCNSWTCPRCGQIRAKREYAKIVAGAEVLAKDNKFWFWTITCRGRELSLSDSESEYLQWTNRLFTALRYRCKKQGDTWAYVQVTERQKRGHPHSHVLFTWAPDDIVHYEKGDWLPNGAKASHDGVWSQWFHDRAVSAGLGPMVDMSEVRSHQAVSRYVAKYLFKTAMTEVWPKGWRRVRYSQSWPKLPDRETEGFAVINMRDWKRVEQINGLVRAETIEIYYAGLARRILNMIPPKKTVEESLSEGF